MALYEFHCDQCGRVFEVKRPISEYSEQASCPDCKSQAGLIPSVFASPDASQLHIPAKEAFRSWGKPTATAPKSKRTREPVRRSSKPGK